MILRGRVFFLLLQLNLFLEVVQKNAGGLFFINFLGGRYKIKVLEGQTIFLFGGPYLVSFFYFGDSKRNLRGS